MSLTGAKKKGAKEGVKKRDIYLPNSIIYVFFQRGLNEFPYWSLTMSVHCRFDPKREASLVQYDTPNNLRTVHEEYVDGISLADDLLQRVC